MGIVREKEGEMDEIDEKGGRHELDEFEMEERMDQMDSKWKKKRVR
jgi:hypothetical protein